MYFLYLDDSGSPGNQREDYFVLGGFAVPETSIWWLTRELDSLAERISRGNGRNIEFHASEIFKGRSEPWRGMNRELRRDTIKSVLRVFDRANEDIVTFACAFHKSSFPRNDPVESAFEDLCSRFNMYLNRIHHDETCNHPIAKGLIIFDESASENSLQRLMKKFQRQGTQWGNLENIVEVPMFVDSKASRLIQLADHVAYSVFRRYNQGDLNYFNCIENRFDSDAGTIHGLAHKQTYKRCTCPACISRQ